MPHTLSTERPAAPRPIRACFYVYFPGGGIGRYTHVLVGTMNALDGLEAHIVGPSDFAWRDDPGAPVWAGLFGVHHDRPLVRRARFLVGQFVNPLRGVRHAAREGADVLHFSSVNHLTFPIWRAVLRRTGLKVAATVHDVRRTRGILHSGWEDRQLKAFYRFADVLFVHSNYQADELVAFAGVDRSRIHVVPHGPYEQGAGEMDRREARAVLGLPEAGRIALFFGQLRDEKNLESLLRALRLADPDLHLVVAGTPASRHRGEDFYRALARDEGVAGRVTFHLRFIEDDEVAPLFSAADWVALPYRDAFTSQSGVLNVAAHYERPVLVTAAPVLRETVEASGIGLSCASDDPEALADGIRRMNRRLDEGPGFDFANYKAVYSWEENARRTRAVYASLLA